MRTDSSFEVEALEDGTKVVKVETHTPDFPRGEFFAVAYEAIGFPQAADECRAHTRQANGFQYPEFIVWKNKELGEIKVRTSDLVQFFPIVVEALMFAKMESLGGMSHADYVNWTPAREEEVQALVRFFMQVYTEGEAELEEGLGDLYPHYFGAALTHVLWALTDKGHKPNVVMQKLVGPALELMLSLDAQARKGGDGGRGGGGVLPMPCR